MAHLNDTELVLLSAASQRANRTLLPPPSTVRLLDQVASAITRLIGVGFAERICSENQTFTPDRIKITAAGEQAIGLGGAAAQAAPTARPTKTQCLINLMQSPGGASLADIAHATGWQPHTIRAAITGVRKKGLQVELIKTDGVSFYRCG